MTNSNENKIDPYFRVDVISSTPKPQTTCWLAMHQDYSEDYVYDSYEKRLYDDGKFPTEAECGEYLIKHCLKKRHFGVIEHPSITFNVGYFPHTVMQQARTHRVGTSFDVQSLRYTGQRIMNWVRSEGYPNNFDELEKLFYLRPIGEYTNRQGNKYVYCKNDRHDDLVVLKDLCSRYFDRRINGLSEEHARDLIPYSVRQHFVVTFNARSLMHFLALRWKKDAQLEIQQMCDLMYIHFCVWMPEIAKWYGDDFKRVGTIAP